VPIEQGAIDGAIHTMLVGQVTDEELLAYYARPSLEQYSGSWRELVDGRRITGMAVTSSGQRKLEASLAGEASRLRGGRLAMLASSDVTYGMFRMWELRREGLGYQVRVFRELAPALSWLAAADLGRDEDQADAGGPRE
jgi:hypothetical protein